MLRSCGKYIFLLVAFLAPGVSVLATNGLVPLLGIASLYPLFYVIRHNRWQTLFALPTVKIFLVLLAFGAASALWGIVPQKALLLSAKWGFLFLLGYCIFLWLKEQALVTTSLENALLWGTAIAVFTLAVDRFTHGALWNILHTGGKPFELYMLNKGATCLALFTWTCFYLLWKRQKYSWAAVAWIICGSILSTLESNAAILAYMLATATFFFILVLGCTGLRILLCGCVLFMCALPFLMLTIDAENASRSLPQLPESAKHRLYIWEFVSHKASEHPILGWGLDSARYFPVEAKDVKHPIFYPLPNHPHNSILQVWLELGMIGLVCFIACIGTLIHTLNRLHGNLSQAAASAMLVSYLTIGLVGYSLWQSWWIATGWIAAIFIRVAFQLPMPALAHKAPAPSTLPDASLA